MIYDIVRFLQYYLYMNILQILNIFCSKLVFFFIISKNMFLSFFWGEVLEM